MSDRYKTFGPLSYQQHTDWRCSTIGWQRGKWRPVVSLRFGRASKPGFGFFIGRDEDEDWELVAAFFRADLMAHVSGPWDGS